jgi:hypothetical protein
MPTYTPTGSTDANPSFAARPPVPGSEPSESKPEQTPTDSSSSMHSEEESGKPTPSHVVTKFNTSGKATRMGSKSHKGGIRDNTYHHVSSNDQEEEKASIPATQEEEMMAVLERAREHRNGSTRWKREHDEE